MAEGTPRRGGVLLVLAGLLLLQTAWILAVPPFRGLDEHEHAFKAAAVAEGDLSATHRASPQGRGQYVVVPQSLVEAARPECESLGYTTPDNCRGRDVGDGRVRVASNAAPYNPVWYAVPGLVSLPFAGADKLYAMRIASALMCAGLLALSVVALRRWARTPWPGVGLLCLLTPTMVYTLSMAAPNGMEMAAATLVWCALLGLARTPAGEPVDRVLVGLGSLGAVLLAVLRGLGPVWLLLVVGAVVLLLDRTRLAALVRDRGVQLAAGASVLATAAAGWWVHATQILGGGPGEVNFPGSPWPGMPAQWVLWFFQSMAAFPARDELAPIAVFVVGFVAWWVFVAFAVRVASVRERLAMLAVVVAVTVVAVAVNLSVYPRLGTTWQGRYGYPLALGFFLLCGAALDRAATTGEGRSWARARWPVWAAGSVLLVVLLVGQLPMLAGELDHSPMLGTGEWWQPSYAVVVLLDVAGAALLTWGLTRVAGVANLVR